MDIAASIQKVTEEIMISLAKSIRKEYGIKNLMFSWWRSIKLCS
jgi:carbamoyltransferase